MTFNDFVRIYAGVLRIIKEKLKNLFLSAAARGEVAQVIAFVVKRTAVIVS